MRRFLILIFVFNGYLVDAQDTDPTTIPKIQEYAEQMLAAIKQIGHKISESKTDHFLYLSKNWQHTTVITTTDEYLHFDGRYNILRNALEANLGEELYRINAWQIKAARIGDRLLVPLSAKLIEEGNIMKFFEVLSSGKLTLLQQFSVGSRVEGGNSPIATMTGETVYYISTDFYYTKDFTSLKKLKRNKNRILELFGEESDDLDAYMDENGLKFRKDEDVIQVFEQFNNGH
ncbi:MAG: hypothetical protein DHS20C18_39290 [Saprospiraceae bacterium]|nr:MAG: hypothetical protein DHS20C18_39290 [Saprospiraceae bacterium]